MSDGVSGPWLQEKPAHPLMTLGGLVAGANRACQQAVGCAGSA